MIANSLYLLFLLLASPFYLWSICRRDKHRAGLGQKFGFSLPLLPSTNNGNNLWIHAVSVGEVLVCRPLISALQQDYPHLTPVISVTTTTGYRIAKKTFPELAIIFFPFDLTWAVKRMQKHINARAILLVELELWPNFIRCAQRRKTPIYVINGRLSENSLRGFKRFSVLIQPMLQRVTGYLMQNERYVDHVRQLNIPETRIHLAGNIKYDALSFHADTDKAQSIAKGLSNNNAPILVAGSTHHPEDDHLLAACAADIKAGKLKLILVPRHPERHQVVLQSIQNHGLDAIRKTQLDDGQAMPENAVILLDTLGELSQTYALANFVYIGGSLNGHGGQNLMEPAALGKAVICGPAMFNFQEVYDELNATGAIITVADAQALAVAIKKLMDLSVAQAIGQKGIACLKAKVGATQTHLRLLKDILQ